MIILVKGLLGTGKTLFLAYLGQKEKILSVFGNFSLKVKNYKKITPYDLEEITKGLILIDEAYSWLESRTSTKEENRYLTNRIGFNSRKRHLTIVLSAQLGSSIDVRFRELTDFEITALGYNPKVSGFVYRVYDRIRYYNFVLPIEKAEELYKIYDTFEPETDSTPTIFEPKRLNDYIEKVLVVLENNFGDKTNNLTKGMINDFLIEKGKGVPSKKMIETIYSRLKRRKLQNE